MTTYDFLIRDCWDNGEFFTGAIVHLIVDGQIVHTEEFSASSEFGPGPDAREQAVSYATSWIECQETTLEERLAPFGREWEREMYERSTVPF